MERLTDKELLKTNYDPWELCGMDGYCTKGCHAEGGCTKGCHILKMYKKLAEYEELEEQGKLLKLPCKLGVKVYYVQRCLAPSCKECLGFTQVNNCYCEFKSRIFEQEFDFRHLKAFGKTVFLTQAEAEAALEKMEDKNNGN